MYILYDYISSPTTPVDAIALLLTGFVLGVAVKQIYEFLFKR